MTTRKPPAGARPTVITRGLPSRLFLGPPIRSPRMPPISWGRSLPTRCTFFEGAPTFAVEVRSENDYGDAAEIAMAAKRARLLRSGHCSRLGRGPHQLAHPEVSGGLPRRSDDLRSWPGGRCGTCRSGLATAGGPNLRLTHRYSGPGRISRVGQSYTDGPPLGRSPLNLAHCPALHGNPRGTPSHFAVSRLKWPPPRAMAVYYRGRSSRYLHRP